MIDLHMKLEQCDSSSVWLMMIEDKKWWLCKVTMSTVFKIKNNLEEENKTKEPGWCHVSPMEALGGKGGKDQPPSYKGAGLVQSSTCWQVTDILLSTWELRVLPSEELNVANNYPPQSICRSISTGLASLCPLDWYTVSVTREMERIPPINTE